MRAVVLFSGGIDSLAALVWSWNEYGKENVVPLYVDLGHRYASKELKAIYQLENKLDFRCKIIRTPFVGKKEKEDAHIPWRNLFLILTATYLLPDDGGDIVIQNVQVGETSIGDRTPEFNRHVESLLRFVERKNVRVIAPFAEYTKGQIVRWLLDNEITEDILKLTVGCFSEEDGHCGSCPACFRRWISLESAGIECRDWFKNDPVKWGGTRKYALKMLRGEYDDRRATETLAVLEKYGIIKGVIAVDMDGVLCETTPWWNYEDAKPIRENIEKVNKLYDEGYGIIIYTARFNGDLDKTYWWLVRNGVKFHRIVTGKIWATHYIDDRSAAFDDILNGGVEK